jgi:hypothetical protein
MLNKVKEIWAMMYLGNIDHQLIAEKHLSIVVSQFLVIKYLLYYHFFVSQYSCKVERMKN